MTINCRGNLIDLSSPKVMGILNITPDSFYSASRYIVNDTLLKTTEQMLKDGATFIDVGGYSSKPGAVDISEAEELKRILPVISLLIAEFPEIIISVDTFRSKIAQASIEAGAALVNDISGGHLDINMIPTIGKLQVPYIMMHMRGTPQTMASMTDYKDLVLEINKYFSEQIQKCKEHQVMDIIIDPGFGFAKTKAQNFELLNKLELLQIVDRPVLAGLSRKSMIYKTLNIDALSALNGTTSLNTIALMKNASILRVHDVKEAMECVSLFNQLRK